MSQKGCKKGGREKFEVLLADELANMPATSRWEQGGYCFSFSPRWEDCAFRWKERTLYVTSCEALHLYQRLVLGRKPKACTSRCVLSNMRKKFGEDFLQEYLPSSEAIRKYSGRRSEFAREVDGSYYRALFRKYGKRSKTV